MRALRVLGTCLLLTVAFALASVSGAFAQSFTDDFSSDTTGSYTLTQTQPTAGTGTLVYDAVGQRARILDGDNFGLRVSQNLPPRSSGRFSVDLLPTLKYPNAGTLTVRLVQDASNYYELTNFTNSTPGRLSKVVGGQVVDSVSFNTRYSQNIDYRILIDFHPDHVGVQAFGLTLALSGNLTPLSITSFQIEAYQQDLYVDTILYGDESATNRAPVAHAGIDLTAAGGDLVTLDASASTDPDGGAFSYFWEQLSGPSVSLSDPGSATPSFVAPDPGTGSTALQFQVTVTDAYDAASTDDVQVVVWAQSALTFTDHFSSDTTASYTLTQTQPTVGTGTLVYDAVGQRAQILDGDNFGLRVAQNLPPRSSGRFSVDLLPTLKYPTTGALTVRLVQDASNYYELTNFTNSTPGLLSKVVSGQVVDSVSFSNRYSQNIGYRVLFDFHPDHVSVQAFGLTLALSGNLTPLSITSFQIEAFQQDLYVDTILYGDESATNRAPVAHAGTDLAAAGGDLVTLDASASTDPDGGAFSYFWEQLSGPSVSLSDPGSATPSFVAPDPGTGSTALQFQVTVTDAYDAASTDDVQVVVWAQSALTFTDDFSSDTTGGYTLTQIQPTVGTAALVYDAVGQRAQILDGDNFGLRVAQNLPPRSSGRFSVDLLPTLKYPTTGTLTVRLVQDASNYYELTNFTNSTPGLLSKVVSGQVVDSASFSNRYSQNTPYNVTIDFSPDLAVVSAYGQIFLLEQDTTPLTISRFEIEAFQQDLYFDNVSYSEFVAPEPSVILINPVAGQFQSSSTLRVEATSFLLEPGWRVVFAIDAGSASEIVAEDPLAPYVVDIADVSKGIHSVDAYVVDAGGNQVIGAELTDHVSNVSIGDYYVGVGDSITKGVGDNFTADNVSADGRDSGPGYPPILNDRLTSLTGYPHTVKNEGVSGKTSLYGATKIAGFLSSHPSALFYLVLFGTNDSVEGLSMPSGLGLLPGDPGYAGTYKANMQAIISAVLASDRLPILMKPPIAYGSCSRCARYLNPETEPRNALIREYSSVIDELVGENALPIEGPDLYAHFAAHPEQMLDRLHPNGIGYQAIADLLAEALLAP